MKASLSEMLAEVLANRDAKRFEFWLKVDGQRVEVHPTPQLCQTAAIVRGLACRSGRRFVAADASVQIRRAPLGTSAYHDMAGLP